MFSIFWLKRCMYSLYSLNTIQNVIERVDNNDLEIDKIDTLNPLSEVLAKTKVILNDLI